MADVVIESLFPEFSNQGGDNGNMMYLKASLPQARFVETAFTDEPAFATGHVDMIYLGYMTEAEQRKVIQKLMPLKGRLEELVAAGTVVLFTGNATEILGKSIEWPDGSKTEALGLLDFTTRVDLSERLVAPYLGRFEDAEKGVSLEVAGYKIQFSKVSGTNDQGFFCTNEVGRGINEQASHEGFRRNNLFATWLCGPLLPLNPEFARYLMGLLGCEGEPAFLAEASAAYKKRVEEFKTPGIQMPI